MAPSFAGLRIVTFESRRAREIGALIRSYGGEAVSAPALREVPLESNALALDAAGALLRGEFDLLVLLTGVGTRAFVDLAATAYDRQAVIDALARVPIVARGPKPVAAVRTLGLTPWCVVPEPNTWRDLLAALDARADERPLSGLRVAVQEYGVSNPGLLEGLGARGAVVTPIPVYAWALPDDLAPLRSAVQALADGAVDVVLFTTGVQVAHLFQVAESMGLAEAVRAGLARAVVASIGPTTSEALAREHLQADVQPEHPKMGFLVREAAARAGEILRARSGGPA